MARLDALPVTHFDIFFEAAWLLDFLICKPGVSLHQVESLWTILLNDIRKWKTDVTDHDKLMVSGTVFMVVRAVLTQHVESIYNETVCDLITQMLEQELSDCDEKEQIVFLERLREQSTALSDWINNYEDTDKWLSDEIADAISYENREDGGNGIRSEGGKPGAKKKSFRAYIINQEETDKVIDVIKKNIHKDNPQQAAMLIVGAIEAGKVSSKVSAPCISREFKVNVNSIKPHLTKYRSCKSTKQPYFTESELEAYIAHFNNQE